MGCLEKGDKVCNWRASEVIGRRAGRVEIEVYHRILLKKIFKVAFGLMDLNSGFQIKITNLSMLFG